MIGPQRSFHEAKADFRDGHRQHLRCESTGTSSGMPPTEAPGVPFPLAAHPKDHVTSLHCGRGIGRTATLTSNAALTGVVGFAQTVVPSWQKELALEAGQRKLERF